MKTTCLQARALPHKHALFVMLMTVKVSAQSEGHSLSYREYFCIVLLQQIDSEK